MSADLQTVTEAPRFDRLLLVPKIIVLAVVVCAILQSLFDSALGTAIIIQLFYPFYIVPAGAIVALSLSSYSLLRRDRLLFTALVLQTAILIGSYFIAVYVNLFLAWKLVLIAIVFMILIDVCICVSMRNKQS
jgi:hypothetical protein